MPAWLIAVCATTAVLLGFVAYIWIAMRRVDALTKLYEHRRTLRNAIETAGGARRPPTTDLALAREAVKAVNVIQWFEKGLLAAEATDRERAEFLEDAALLLHAILSDAEIRRLTADPSRIKLQPLNAGMNSLTMWTTSGLIGEAVKRAKAEGLS